MQSQAARECFTFVDHRDLINPLSREVKNEEPSFFEVKTLRFKEE